MTRRIVALVLIISLLVAGCGIVPSKEIKTEENLQEAVETPTTETEPAGSSDEVDSERKVELNTSHGNEEPLETDIPLDVSFAGLDDPELIPYIENTVYRELVHELNSEDYFVESVEAVYVSQEYAEELSFNSMPNSYFGFTLAELYEQFNGSRYIFTIDESGKTVVREMETLYDDSAETIIKNAAVGGGVILLCTTVSVVSGALGGHAVCVILAAGAKTGTQFALSSGVIGGITAAITTGYQTQDLDQALEAGSLAVSESFKWGAITGTLFGGAGKGISLFNEAKQTSFTMNQLARIQRESDYPIEVIKEFHNMEEYEAFRNANLKPAMVGKKSALIKTDIDLNVKDSTGRTNLERMRQGLAPLDPDGKPYELHHIGQKKDSTLAVLTRSEHDNKAIHGFLERTEAHAPDTSWDSERQKFWKEFAKMVAK